VAFEKRFAVSGSDATMQSIQAIPRSSFAFEKKKKMVFC
jgi:hypothetical protein